MKLLEEISIAGNLVKARISVDTLETSELNAVARFGDLVVDVGGSFASDSDTDVTFSLPVEQRYFPSQFPVQKVFALSDADAPEKAETWLQTIVGRLVELRDIALLKDASVIRSEIIDYPAGV